MTKLGTLIFALLLASAPASAQTIVQVNSLAATSAQYAVIDINIEANSGGSSAKARCSSASATECGCHRVVHKN